MVGSAKCLDKKETLQTKLKRELDEYQAATTKMCDALKLSNKNEYSRNVALQMRRLPEILKESSTAIATQSSYQELSVCLAASMRMKKQFTENFESRALDKGDKVR